MRRDTKLGVQLTVFEEVDDDQRAEVFDTALGHIRASGWTVLPGPCERMPEVSGTELMTEFRWPVTRDQVDHAFRSLNGAGQCVAIVGPLDSGQACGLSPEAHQVSRASGSHAGSDA